MTIRIVSYDTDAIPSGERFIVLNGSDPIRFDSLDELKQEIIDCCGDVKDIVYDNQARINNIEDRDLRKEILTGLDQASIRKEFDNEMVIKVYYGRKEVNNVVVRQRIPSSNEERVYEELEGGYKKTYHEQYDSNNNVIARYVQIETDKPISGYVLIL